MSRLIDADAFSAVMKQRQDTVKEWMSKGKDKETCARAGSSYVMLCEVKLTLDQMPTIDAVEVVRCQNCKYYCGEETYTNHRICKMWNEEVFANGYCYMGKRKEKGNE